MATLAPVHLDGRAIVITGAGRGLGRAYALAAARAGARLVLNDSSPDGVEETAAQIRAIGGEAVVEVGSVEDGRVAEQLITRARSALGRIDGLIANAGVMHVTSAFDESAEAMARVLAVNVLGTMLCGVAALRAMREQASGSLVLVTSGARFGMEGLSTYGASKGAVASLVWSWAREAEAHGIRVNGMSPIAQTPMFALNPAVSGGSEPESIAPLAVYLLSGACSMTGQIVRLDGRALSVYPAAGGEGAAVVREQWSAADIADAISAIAPAS
jgi:NAD(P)-dependent dehydrogenase (short-subunit alcohol dehydrogenase family)